MFFFGRKILGPFFAKNLTLILISGVARGKGLPAVSNHGSQPPVGVPFNQPENHPNNWGNDTVSHNIAKKPRTDFSSLPKPENKVICPSYVIGKDVVLTCEDFCVPNTPPP